MGQTFSATGFCRQLVDFSPLLALLLSVLGATSAARAEQGIRIGELAQRGAEYTPAGWQPATAGGAEYLPVILLTGALLLILTAAAAWLLNLNRHLRRSESDLQQARHFLEQRVEERTAELSRLNRLLEEENQARLEALSQLADERQRLTVTLRSIGDGVITTDTARRVELLNAVAEEMCGWTEEEARGRRLTEVFQLINHRTGQAVVDPVEKVLATGRVVELANHVSLVAKDGSRRSIADSAAPIIDIDGTIIGAVLVFRDVTEKERLEEEAIRAQKMESLGVMAGGIAHDFNNALTAIHGNVSLARLQLPANGETAGLLQSAEVAIMQASGLARQLLTFAKGGKPIRKVVPMATLIRDSVEMILRGSAVRAEFELATDLRPAEVDAGQITQVLQNLAVNARQAMPEGGVLQVKADNHQGPPPDPAIPHWLCLIISDQGPGIPPELQERVFDPYFTTKEGGNGLGLAICQAIVSKHNGTIKATASAGGGTEFTILLPATDMDPERTVLAVRHRVPPARILLMDDDPMVADVIRRSLENLGHLVVTVGEGAAAISAWRQAREEGQPFQWGLLDLTVSGAMGGVKAAAEIRHLDHQARLIVLSGYSDDQVLTDPSRYGFQGGLVKPCTIGDLETMVGNAAF
ncbi:ATP-binding protein [Desulfurivibrio alkaliphilus]|uniref:histidine kinase n=1 Tax=Desulfurivibrio alkaliphilus (strain DSM 19089 / UNIQEM U267 / AHT2) TaxID=589865 RepID=D6Z258_DESAT|nr:ATP-binding protein [Desulfurivibrio alkaliphilus]ADH85633.1 PAS/PAC sensor hybrid histidine kinase [Desulfurivibrio alkaliphilus AHT 2]